MQLLTGFPTGRCLARLALAMGLIAAGAAYGEDEKFDIARFDITGSHLLSPPEMDALVAPFVGPGRIFGDIQKALHALENAYHAKGYGAIQVAVPEQELSDGVVHLTITESTIGAISIHGNHWFNDDNVRAALPALQPGQSPNMRRIAENIEVANENPAKNVNVTLAMSDDETKINADVRVVDESPRKVSLTFDNTGTMATGMTRLGVAVQDANIGNQDAVLNVAYVTSPAAPPGTQIDTYSGSLHIPFYEIGDSIDLLYGTSSANTTVTQATGFSLVGKGDIASIHWNHHFPRDGEYASKLIAGVDYKYMHADCSQNGQSTPSSPTASNLIASCIPYTVVPVFLTYMSQQEGPGEMFEYSISALQNIPTGDDYPYTTATGNSGMDRYSLVSTPGARTTPDDFSYLKANVSVVKELSPAWSVRVALHGQYSAAPLPSPEQISITGATAVRGFNEHTVAGDAGLVLNLEAYGPDIAPTLQVPGSLKYLFFYDNGFALNYAVTGIPQAYDTATLSSIGTGMRFAWNKKMTVNLDIASVLQAGPVASGETVGDWRAHLAMQLDY